MVMKKHLQTVGNGNDERWCLNVDKECWNGKIGINYCSTFADRAGTYMGCMALMDDGGSSLNNDVHWITYLASNPNGNHSNPDWEFVKIPENCVKIGFSDGSGNKTKFDIYEVKYVE